MEDNQATRGIGQLATALVLWAIGIGVSVWLGIYIGIHNFRHQLSQEERAAVYTGAAERPKSKIVVQIIPRDCSTVTRADLDGSSLVLYARNDCHKTLTYFEWHWQEVSPNGVVLHESYTNQCAVPSLDGDIAECTFSEDGYNGVTTDSRTDKVRVWTSLR